MRELALHILDLVQNAREAGARHVAVRITEAAADDALAIEIRDDGRGMDAATVARVTDPFFTTRTSRHVGLGLPLAAAGAQQAGGGIVIESTPGEGTCVKLRYRWHHWDRPPMGDLPATLMAILLGDADLALQYVHQVDQRAFCLDSQELRQVLEDVPLSHPAVRAWLNDFLRTGEAALAFETVEES